MRRRVADSELTRIAILDAGTRVFARIGFERATLEAIGREANLTRGAIYWHFKDKHDLFTQILRRERDRLELLVVVALAGEGSSFCKLRRLLDMVVDNFYDQETFRQFIELTWYKLGPAQVAPVMDSKTTFVQSFLAHMQRLLAEALAARETIPTIDVHLTALHLSCLINGLYRLYHVAPEWARDKDVARRLFTDFLDSIATGHDAAVRP